MEDATPFRAHRDGTLIDVIVQLRASKSEIAGIYDGALRIRIAAPPVDGAANAAVVDLLRKLLNVSKNEIQIVSGATGRRKRVLVRGMAVDAAREQFVS